MLHDTNPSSSAQYKVHLPLLYNEDNAPKHKRNLWWWLQEQTSKKEFSNAALWCSAAVWKETLVPALPAEPTDSTPPQKKALRKCIFPTKYNRTHFQGTGRNSAATKSAGSCLSEALCMVLRTSFSSAYGLKAFWRAHEYFTRGVSLGNSCDLCSALLSGAPVPQEHLCMCSWLKPAALPRNVPQKLRAEAIFSVQVEGSRETKST